MIGIIDYNAGNLSSICNALENIGIKYFISADPEKLKKSRKIVFPGVGHAASAMRELKKRKLDVFLKNTKTPVLGICVGMQLLFDFSEERYEKENTPCLGIIPGLVKKFTKEDVKIVPHMGWNEVSQIQKNTEIFLEIPDYMDFYFVHSFYCFPTSRDDVISMTDYGVKSFCSGVQKDNFIGVQFHPEKSSVFGKKILKNFCKK